MLNGLGVNLAATGATGPAGGGTTAADNGLTLAPGPTVQLGGVLNQNTSVTFGGVSNFALSFGDNIGFGSSPNLRLGNTAGISATQTANAQFGGSVSAPIRVVTSNYTLAPDDYTVLRINRDISHAFGIPFGCYVQTFHAVEDYDSISYRDPSPSELRLNHSGALAFDAKLLIDFHYTD